VTRLARILAMARVRDSVSSVQGAMRRTRKESAQVSEGVGGYLGAVTRCECFSFVQTWMSAVGMRLYVRMGPTASTLQGATSVTPVMCPVRKLALDQAP